MHHSMLAFPTFRRAVALLAALTLPTSTAVYAQVTPTAHKPSIVLVHGALADAMSWSRVIALLENGGYHVTTVENPLTSLDADVTTTKRMIDAQVGPVVVVGHSYGGAVISNAATGNANVKALVYIAGLAPDSGEAVSANLDKYPSPLSTAFAPDAAGFLYVDRVKLRDVFAADLPITETGVLAATQKPINSAIFQSTLSAVAWKHIPSWYLVAQQDRAINPEFERLLAKRMHATTVEIASSHLPMLSHPAAVVRLIEQAAMSSSASTSKEY